MSDRMCARCRRTVHEVYKARRSRTISVRVTDEAGQVLDGLVYGDGTVADVVRDALGHYLDMEVV